MVEPADLGKRHDLSGTAGLNRSPVGGVLAQRKMRSGSVVIIEVRNKDPSQMSFIQDDHVVQAQAGKEDPEHAVERAKPRPWSFPLQDRHLLAESDIFQL